MFLYSQMGNDGSKYVQNVKYKLQEETSTAFNLTGKDGFVNKFSKRRLRNRFTVWGYYYI